VIKSLFTEQATNETKTIEIRKLFDEVVQSNLSENIEIDTEHRAAQTAEEIKQRLLEAEEKANQIISKAEQDADTIRAEMEDKKTQLEQEVELAIREGQQQGFEQGIEQGKEAAYQEYLEQINEAKGIVQRSHEDYLQTIEEAEPVIVELATSLCQRIIGSTLQTNQDLWASMIKQVMLEVREHENVKIYVHPEWYETTVQQKNELEQLLSHTENLYIYPDAGLEKEGCIVETKYGRIDATVDSQLNQLKTQLLEKMREA
jgi:flagellar assembly protein FliH